MSELKQKIESLGKEGMNNYPSVEIGVLVDPRPFLQKEMDNPYYMPLNSMSYLDFEEAQTAILDSAKLGQAVMVKSPFNTKNPEIRINPKIPDGSIGGLAGKLSAVPNVEKWNVVVDLINVGGNRTTPTVIGMTANQVAYLSPVSNQLTGSISDSTTPTSGSTQAILNAGNSSDNLLEFAMDIMLGVLNEDLRVNSTVRNASGNVQSAFVLGGKTVTEQFIRRIGINRGRLLSEDDVIRNKLTPGIAYRPIVTQNSTAGPRKNVREP
jgi:hypothetical protein